MSNNYFYSYCVLKVSELSTKQKTEIKSALLALKEDLEKSIEMSNESAQAVELDEPIGRLTRMDALQRQGITQSSRNASIARLRAVEAALVNLSESEYGECQDCGEMISYKRLLARPESCLCIECKERRE